MPGIMKSGYLKDFCSKAGRISGSLLGLPENISALLVELAAGVTRNAALIGKYSELTKTSTALARLAVLFVLFAARRLVLI